jgi:hypothetical protein
VNPIPNFRGKDLNNPLRLTKLKQTKRYLYAFFLDFVFLRNKRSRVTQLSAEFVFHMKRKHPETKFFYTREGLWRSFATQLQGASWRGFEFGVASGDSTKKLLKMPYSKTCESWHGFDTFTGLPMPWGDLPQGAFSTGGEPPKIKDERISWHMGPIEQTYKSISEVNTIKSRLLVIFDFDLYGASKVAWDEISKSLKTGDIVYFDEAYEFDEAKLITEILDSQIFELRVLGYTSMGIAFYVM